MLPLTPLRKFLMPIFPFILVNLSFKNLIFEAFWASKFSQPLETNSILCCKIEKWPPLNQLCWQKLLQKKKVFNVLAPFVEKNQVCFCQSQIHSFFKIDFYWFLAVINFTFLHDIQIPHCCHDLVWCKKHWEH